MKLLALSRWALCISASAGILSGCGGSQAGTPNVVQPVSAPNARNHAGSRVTSSASTTAFTVSGRNILLNGTPFFIKGVDYGNTQIDAYSDPNPLDNANEKVWQPDLVAMRAAGVNAVKVYNVTLASFKPYEDIIGGYNKLRPYESGKIDKFLNAAWNGGNHPIYVVLSVFFGGVNVVEPKYLNALNAVYGLMTTEYGAHQAVMGVSIGSEINSEEFINQPVWWKGLNEINKSVTDAYKGVNAQKITTTTMVDDGLHTVRAGELAGFKADTWGIDVYRGRTLGRIWNEIASSTQKPTIIAEYGASSGYYPASSARYETSTGTCTSYPAGTKDSHTTGSRRRVLGKDIKELPASGNPRMDFLVSYATSNANEIFAHRAINAGGVTSGGFYFEWNDEWWKSGWPFKHIGGFEGNKIVSNADFPGCYDDQAWFGLNADKKNGAGDPFPRRPADTRVPRPTLKAMTNVWAKE